MHPNVRSPNGLSARGLGLLGVVLAAAALTALVRSRSAPAFEDPAPPSRSSPYSSLQPARNPARLDLLVDAGKVLGWIGGTKDHAGERVKVRLADKVSELKIEKGNTFTWSYRVEKPTQAEFTYGAQKQKIKLSPPIKRAPSVFFVVDRSVYRPKQTLQFAGFLRELDERGEFVPLPRRDVEVLLTSEAKKTVAARLKLTSDQQGRILGRYTFVEADPLDQYRLSIPEHRGEARVVLAEYRKSKTHLNISGRMEGERLDVRFQARDYLDKPLRGARVKFVAQVVRDPVRAKPQPLNSKEFAYAGEDQPQALRLEDLTTEERLLAQLDDGIEAVAGLNVSCDGQLVTEIKGQVDLGSHGEAVFPLALKKSWLESGHAVRVQGVMIDADKREERCTRTIPLVRNDDVLELSLPRSRFQVNELIHVTARSKHPAILGASGTLVAMRLVAPPPAGFQGFLGGQFGGLNGGQFNGVPPGFGGITGLNGGLGGGLAGFNGGMAGFIPMRPAANWSAITRTLATAIVFRGDTATLKLTEPGAYVLTAIVHKRDGTRWRQEIGCTVEPAHDLPPLTLQLDRDTYSSRDTLTGAIYSRYANACVLLTLRDSNGIRLWKTLRLVDGMAELKVPLPADLRYGCAVEVQYADSLKATEPTHVASKLIHVVPVQRMLTIESQVKPVCEPGEKAVIDLQVNRKEPVDLIVSVYDKALLGIAPDRAVDARSFYFADDRVVQTHAREALRRRLGGLTVGDLIKRAQTRLRQQPAKPGALEGNAVQALLTNAAAHRVLTADVATLLRLAGVKTRVVEAGHTWDLPVGAQARQVAFFDWLDTAHDGWRLHYSLLDETAFLTAYHPTQYPMPWAASPGLFFYTPYTGFNGFNGSMGGIAGLGGMSGIAGVGGIGGLGGIGGIAGLGGGGFNQLGAQGRFQGNFRGAANLGVGGGMMGFGGFGGHFPMGMPKGGSDPKPPFLVQAPRTPPLLGSDTRPPHMPIRQDFSDCAYWNAAVRTDANGKAKVEFKLPDSLTSWQVVVTAVTKDLHVGRHQTSFQTAKSLMVNPILPRFFTEGDKVHVFATVQNHSNTRQIARVRLKADNGKVHTPAEQAIALAPGGSGSVSWVFQAGDAGFAPLLISAESKAGSDASLKRLPVVRAGVEHVETQSGFCKDNATIEVPKGVDPRQVVFEVRFAPTLTADLLDTLKYLVDYPYGCVEQTMSRFLPAIKVAQVLQRLRLEDPELNKKLPGCVAAGIKRLLELQHADGGWGWWTNDQTHEMMTPYALYGLLEAERAGYPIGSQDAIHRGLQRLKEFIDHMGPKRAADRIYCMYVYGQRHNLTDAWWGFIDEQCAAKTLSDYALALALELAVRQKQTRLADRLAADLRGRAQESAGQVHWRTARFSRWADDPLEVTAVALKALIACNKDDKLIPGVLAFFVANKRDNRWNSTKDTAMIVYALCDYLARQDVDPKSRASIAFRCNDGPVHTVPFTQLSESRKVIVPAKQVRAGLNRLTFADGTPGMMYRLTVRYWVSGRAIPAESHGIRVTRRYWLLDDKGQRSRELKSGDEVPRGAYLESAVEALPSAGGGVMRYVLVENPRPAGCEVLPIEDRRFDQQGTACLLREERETLVAYHHDETSGQVVDRCVLHAELPGDFLVPAARVEMMYQTDVRGHSGSFAFRVAMK